MIRTRALVSVLALVALSCCGHACGGGGGAAPVGPGPQPPAVETVVLYADDLQNQRFDAFLPSANANLAIVQEGGGNYVADLTSPVRLDMHPAARSSVSWEDYALELRVRTQGAATIGFGVRCTTPNIGYWLLNTGNQWTIERRRSLTDIAVLRTQTFAPPPGTWYRLELGVRTENGGTTTRLTAAIDGTVFLQHEDTAPLLFGNVCLEVEGAGAHLLLDDCKITGTVRLDQTWTKAPGPAGGLIGDIAIDPRDPTVAYMAAGDGGLFKTSDGGSTWTEIGLPNGLWKVRIRNIVLAPSDPDVVYIGCAGKHVSSLWRSDDGGQSWRWTVQGEAMALDPNEGETYALIVDPTDPMHIFFGADKRGVWESADGGDSLLNPFPGGGMVSALAMDPFDSQTMLAGTAENLGGFGGQDALEWQPSGVSIWRTTDGGTTWTQSDTGIHDEIIVQLEFDPSTPDRVFALIEREGMVYRSVNGGLTWSALDYSSVFGTHVHTRDFGFSLQPAGTTLVVLTESGSITSTDGGSTWTLLESTPRYSADFSTADPDVIYAAGDDGGVAVSTDFGKTWTNSSNGISAHPPMALTVDPTNAGIVYAGSSYGLYRSVDFGVTWTKLVSGDVLAVTVDPSDTATLYAGFRMDADTPVAGQTALRKSVDSGLTWTDLTQSANAANDDLEFSVGMIAVDPSDSQVVYAGTSDSPQGRPTGEGLYKSTDGGQNWTKQGLPDVAVPALLIDPADTNHLVAGTLANGIYVSYDGGQTFTQRNNGLLTTSSSSVLPVFALAMHPTNADVLYAGTSSHYAGLRGQVIDALYKSVDGGLNWTTLFVTDEIQAAAKGVPVALSQGSIDAIVIDPTDPQHVFVALHDPGIIMSDDGGSTWRFAQEGFVPLLTHVYAYRVSCSSDGRVLYSASCGRGIFRNFLEKTEAAGP